MPIELWGATGTLGIAWPERPVGTLLLALYGAILAYIIYRYRDDLRRMSSRQWLMTAGFAALSLLTSQLAPLSIAQNPATTLILFAAAPFLLAGAVLNPGAALIAGLFSGLGRALGQSHYPFDIFNFALAAVVASIWMRQSYRGRNYQWLRQPPVAGALNAVGLIFFIGLATFAGGHAAAGNLAALDLALSTAGANFWPLLIEGAVGGGLVMLILVGLPQLKPAQKLKPSPIQLSLRNRLLSNFVLFAVVLTALLTAVLFSLSVDVSTRLVVNQMAHNAKTVSAEIPEFQEHLRNVLLQYRDDAGLLTGDVVESEKTLQQLFRSNPVYRRVLLVDAERGITAFYPADVETIALTEREELSVSHALTANTPDITPAQTNEDEHIISFVVPVHDDNGAATAVLIGRVPQLSLDNLIVGLQGTVGQGSGFIVDEHNQIIAHSDSDRLLNNWLPPEGPRLLRAEEIAPGTAYQGRQGQTNARELVYYVKSELHPWTIVINVPYEVVLNLALRIGAPLTLVLLLVMAAFYANLAVIGRDITTPITELAHASKTIAAGEKWTPLPDAQRDDEIGQLNQAFFQMVQSRNKRLRELSLLLGVSHEVSTSVDLNRGMAAILRGALRGTKAAGARAVVLNPSGGYPIQFGEGPAAKGMAALDRQIMSRLRHDKELLLSTAEEVRQALELSETAVIPVPAFMGIPLHSHDRFQGVLWLGYRKPHHFDQTERNLLQTMAGQAAVLVENARLFATAEGGRRRLAAVLSSTSDAVIVTDQTDRVLLINRAMERAFKLKAGKVTGRPLADVVSNEALGTALSGSDERARSLEIPTDDGKIYYASASTIFNNEGQAIGRVAVLHDITHLKEIDELKSDFVRNVSHDLRNPLTFMRGYTTMLSMVGDVNPDQQKYIDKIQSGIDQMKQLVDDVLDLSSIEAGIALHPEEIEAGGLLTDIADEHWQQAHLKGIKIEVDVKSGIPTFIGDKLQIHRALANLVVNGIKYAPNSGRMELKAEYVNGEIVFSVKDNGPGIPKKNLMRVFEKFYRAQQRGEEKEKGSGLGLAIVKSIAEMHGGRAWCHSQRGLGSTFYFSAPLQPAGENGRVSEQLPVTSNQ
ncbi:MAG: PAS domain-containing protein [Chloroflexi bacterium]|nr:PAS domain-containing protein [Chloroflexota bacterium]